MEKINDYLFLLINATSASPLWLLSTALFIADYLVYLIPVVLAALWLWGRSREVAVKALSAALIALGINQLIGLLYVHPRPFMIGIGHTFIVHAADSSFPSDHGTLFFAVALGLLAGRVWLVGLAVLLTGMVVAWSRLYLGLHFPFDMLGALLVAGLGNAIVHVAWSSLGIPLMARVVGWYRIVFAIPIAKKWVQA